MEKDGKRDFWELSTFGEAKLEFWGGKSVEKDGKRDFWVENWISGSSAPLGRRTRLIPAPSSRDEAPSREFSVRAPAAPPSFHESAPGMSHSLRSRCQIPAAPSAPAPPGSLGWGRVSLPRIPAPKGIPWIPKPSLGTRLGLGGISPGDFPGAVPEPWDGGKKLPVLSKDPKIGIFPLSGGSWALWEFSCGVLGTVDGTKFQRFWDHPDWAEAEIPTSLGFEFPRSPSGQDGINLAKKVRKKPWKNGNFSLVDAMEHQGKSLH